MTLDQARHFVQMKTDETGRWPVIYGGALLRESIAHNSDAILSNCLNGTHAMRTHQSE